MPTDQTKSQGAPEMSPDPDQIYAWLKEIEKACGCCPFCDHVPCDGVAAGGMCDGSDCGCFDFDDPEDINSEEEPN